MQHLLTVLRDVLAQPRPYAAAEIGHTVAGIEAAASHPGRSSLVLLHADWLHRSEHPLFDYELTASLISLSHQAPFAFTDLLA